MTAALFAILASAAPLAFAGLGALATEHAGVLAVFMDGAITLAGLLCVLVACWTGQPALGFLAAAVALPFLLALVAIFTERFRANPFITGLAANLAFGALSATLSLAAFGTKGVVSLSERGVDVSFPRNLFFPAALAAAFGLAFVLKRTPFGLRLRASGPDPDALRARGLDPARYRVASWAIAGFAAACSGAILAFGLGAFVPNMSAGRGWTALAAVYLGYRRPLPILAASVLFAACDYATTVLQGVGAVPSTVILGLPYALALIVFLAIPNHSGK